MPPAPCNAWSSRNRPGIGGDCFALIAPRGSDRLIAYNGSGRTPAAATAEWYRDRGMTALPRQSPHTVTIPGAVEAWSRLARDHGTMTLGALLQPAIEHAETGYVVAPRVAYDWIRQRDLLANDPHAARVFLPDGKAPAPGAVHRQPELARSLRAIAAEGADAFYQGEIAADIVGRLRELGGLHTIEDFRDAKGAYETPIQTRYRGYDIHECGPNGHGVVALLILNILSGFAPADDPLSPDRLHLEIEATRLAYSIRDAVLGDPEHGPVPVDWLLSDALAAELRCKIDLRRRLTPLPQFSPGMHRDTVYISVVDKDRNAVSFINSVFSPFGAGIVSPHTGVLLHNRGQAFVLTPGHPNCIGPRKRPLHTIIPGMATRDGRACLSFGVMGGHYQAMGHAHLIGKLLDYGLDVQTAIDHPRVFPRPGTETVEAEAPVPSASLAELARRGFAMVAPDAPIGGAQAIAIDWEAGTLTGGSDPRKDGCALGY